MSELPDFHFTLKVAAQEARTLIETMDDSAERAAQVATIKAVAPFGPQASQTQSCEREKSVAVKAEE